VEHIAFLPIGPEIVALAGAVIVLMSAVALNLGRREWGVIAGVTLLASAILSVLQWLRLDSLEVGRQLAFSSSVSGNPDLYFHPMVVMDKFSAFAGVLVYLVAFLALVGSWKLVATFGKHGAEYVALVLLAAAGMHMMAISSNLILLFMGLETASIALYIIAGFARGERNSDESALKYFLLGSFASAIFLYGIALVYAGTGSVSIYGSGTAASGTGSIRQFFATEPVAVMDVGVLLAGIGLIIVGLGFKVSAAPFHQWAPDVYQGAASGSVALMSAGVKVASITAMVRVLMAAFPTRIDDWAPILAVISVLSIVIGTIGAIGQRDLKRLLAYSGVAHAGFMLTAFVAGPVAIPNILFYLTTYVIQLVGAFTIVAVVSGVRSGASRISDYKGMFARSPRLAMTLAIFLLGMAGIPFFSGFIGKVAVFGSAIGAGYTWLVIIALIAAVAGLFFYLRVIVVMFFEPAADAPGTATAEPQLTGGAAFVVYLTAGLTLLFGVVPWLLLNLLQYTV